MRRFTQSILTGPQLNSPRLESAFPWLLALLALAFVALNWSQPLATAPDSGGYLNFSEHRTAGYPLFLEAVDALFGTTDAAPKVQLVISAASFAFLGWSLNRAFRSALFALLPVVALMLYPRVTELHAHILTESIFISLMCLMVGGIALALRHPSWRWAALAALACGLAITVRPAGASLLIVWPFLFWLTWRRCEGRRIALAASVIAPIALCLLAETLVWHAAHDSESRPNLSDRHLFAKALVIQPEPSLSDPELAAIVDMGREVFAPARALIADAPSLYARATLLAEFEVTGQHETYRKAFSPAVRELAGQRGLEEHQVLAQIGRPAMLSQPVAWIENALTHYLGIWARAFVTPAALDEFQSYIDHADRNEFFERISFFSQGVPPCFPAGHCPPLRTGYSPAGYPGIRPPRDVAAPSRAVPGPTIDRRRHRRSSRSLAPPVRRAARRHGRPLRRLHVPNDGRIRRAPRRLALRPAPPAPHQAYSPPPLRPLPHCHSERSRGI